MSSRYWFIDMKDAKLKKYAIIDANLNRAAEGLRVVEDWARFYLRDRALTENLRNVRHGLWQCVSDNYPEIIKGRDTGEDLLADTKEAARNELDDIPKASFNRVKEALRVLEEMGKIISPEVGNKFKKMRFSIYDIEREFYGRNN